MQIIIIICWQIKFFNNRLTLYNHCETRYLSNYITNVKKNWVVSFLTTTLFRFSFHSNRKKYFLGGFNFLDDDHDGDYLLIQFRWYRYLLHSLLVFCSWRTSNQEGFLYWLIFIASMLGIQAANKQFRWANNNQLFKDHHQ